MLPCLNIISPSLVLYIFSFKIHQVVFALQELIQNADDAGATEVKFLYDHNSYGSDSLVSPQLSKFQGPALYTFNNAKFKAEDWEGIQNIMESSKKEDQLKVGRFGIGFNSIYHITGEKCHSNICHIKNNIQYCHLHTLNITCEQNE